MDNNIHGLQVVGRAAKISHFLFADDYLLFVCANINEVDCLMKTLDRYQSASYKWLILINLKHTLFEICLKR